MGRTAKDITGAQFGKLTVLEYQGNSLWLCECECGNTKLARKTDLELGKVKSCGKCINTTGKLKDIKGKRFNEWYVLEYDGNSKWKCQCSCGAIKSVTGYDLRNNKSKSCGHNENKPDNDISGKTFNEWSVIRYKGNGYYECVCSCSVKKDVLGKHLISGASKSCGHTKYISLVNKKFGMLTLKKYIGNNIWECQCDCGKICNVNMSNIISGKTMSCGCQSMANPLYTYDDVMRVIQDIRRTENRYPYIDEISTKLGVNDSTTYRYIEKYSLRNMINHGTKSRYEREILSILSEENVISNDRTILDGDELDIYIPEKKIAIEFNGNYYHSELYKDVYYHQRKTIECAKKGIRLIHIFEYEWLNEDTKKKIINMIKDHNKNVYYGRNTIIQDISDKEAQEFINKYHLQGYSKAQIKIGCYNKADMKLLGVMTLGTPRFNSNYQYEIIRLCWRNDVAVVGGIQKLFEYFKHKYNPESVITYVNISKFKGNSYLDIGFKPANKYITEPNYIWYNLYTGDIKSRYETQKKRLIELNLGNADETEYSIMHKYNYYRIYDAGNLILEWYNNGDDNNCNM